MVNALRLDQVQTELDQAGFAVHVSESCPFVDCPPLVYLDSLQRSYAHSHKASETVSESVQVSQAQQVDASAPCMHVRMSMRDHKALLCTPGGNCCPCPCQHSLGDMQQGRHTS